MGATALATKKDRLNQLIVEQLSVNADDIKPEHNVQDDLGADSLDKVELVMAIEDEFGIRVSDDDADGLHTVQQFLDYIEKNTE